MVSYDSLLMALSKTAPFNLRGSQEAIIYIFPMAHTVHISTRAPLNCMNCAHWHQTVAAVVLSCPCGSALSKRRSVPWCKLLSAPVCWTCCFVALFISTATANKQSKADLQALLSMQRDRHVYEFTEIQFLMYLVYFSDLMSWRASYKLHLWS